MQGVDLPSGRWAHCMVDLRDGRVILIGGYPTYKEAFFYHLSNRSSTRAPYLNEDRWDHACTLFQSVKHNNRSILLVAGGFKSGYKLTSVQILDFTVPGAIWQTSEIVFSHSRYW